MTFDSQFSTPPANPYTKDHAQAAPYAVLACVFAVTFLVACGPNIASGDGVSLGETGDPGDGDPMPGSEVLCVEMTPGSVTCWVDWEPGVHARVILDCQADAAVTAGAWGPPYESELESWGLVLCHDILGTDGSLCLFGDSRVLLTDTVNGWVPDLSVLVSEYEPVPPPCGAEPGDGDGDPGDGDPGDGDPGGRLRLVEFKCVDVCQGRWDGTDLWSLVSDASEVAASIEVVSPWVCNAAPDVDICVEVDVQGHVGCFWYQDGWAVAVAPSCAVSGEQWLDVGNDMRSSATTA